MLYKNGLINMNRLDDFYTYLQSEKRYSYNTVKAYKRDLTFFNNYLKSEQIEEIDDQVIKNYLAYLYTNSARKKTIARKISSIKSYFKFLNKKFNVNCDFINNIKTPKKDKLLPELIYKDEIKKILN